MVRNVSKWPFAVFCNAQYSIICSESSICQVSILVAYTLYYFCQKKSGTKKQKNNKKNINYGYNNFIGIQNQLI